MLKIRSLQKYLTFFFLFGQNSYISLNDLNKNYSSIHFFVPWIILLLLSYTMVILSIILIGRLPNFQAYHLLAIRLFLSNLLIGTKCRASEKEIREVLCALHLIMDRFETFWAETIKIGTFDKSFFRKLLCALIANLIFFSIKNLSTQTLGLYFEFFASISFLYVCISAFHVTFYVDLLAFVMISLNKKLQIISENTYFQPTKRMTTKETIRIFRFVKNYHLNCYQISRKINRRFGWFLICFLVESTSITVSQSFFAFYVLFKKTGSAPEILIFTRKYHYPFIHNKQI